jgi:hypothetical protein
MVLARSKSRARDGELTTVLEKMLDAGQIECEPLLQGSTEIFIGVRVTPIQIRELLPLARHPIAQALLRFFLEGHLSIPRLTGAEDKLPFQRMPGADFDVFPSGVQRPPELDEPAKQFHAELEVVEYLGVPFRRDVDGWADLYVAGRSVEIRCVGKGDEWLSYPTIEDFKKDVVIAALPTTPDDIALLGWVDREQFLRLRRTVNRAGMPSCVFDLTDLLPMDALRRAARQNAFSAAE